MSKKELIVPLFLLGCVAALFSMPEDSFGQSPADCQAYAKRVQSDSGSVIGGTGRGAARGAAFGAIVGDSDSTRKGAALGAAVGGVRRSARRNGVYQQAYDNCMAGKVQF